MSMMSVTFEVMFRVIVDVEPDEVVCVVGDCDKLGKWDPHHAIPLNKESSPRKGNDDHYNVEKSTVHRSRNIWRARVKLCGMKDYKYRYFVCKMMDPDSEESEKYVKIIRWETNIEPRIFSPAEYINDPHKYDKEIAIFGSYGNKSLTNQGWLTDQSEIHFRLHGNSIHMWKPKYRQQTYSIKCTPLDQRYKDHLDEDDEEWGSHTSPPTTFTQVLVSVLERDLEVPRTQSHYGQIYREGSYINFTCQTTEPESLGFQFDFYVHEEEEKPRHVGYCFLLPFDLRKTNDMKKVPITGLKHRPIGQILLDYLIVRPLPGLKMSMEMSYQNYWKSERGSLDVGHRGMGSSYKHKKLAALRENTVRSLQFAASHGADYVEFDVQLSKDLVPVIYHDFHVAITYRKKKRNELEYFKVSVKDISLDELQSMKLSHTSTMSEKDLDELHLDDQDPADLQPFPTLQRCFEAVEKNVGFNVEVKYPQEQANGTMEEEHFMSRNKYVDIILRCVFEFAGKRRIIFSSFDCDCCLLLRQKQNKYPVLLLTNGETDFYVPYEDKRTRTIQQGIYFSKFANLLGIDVFTKPLMQNLHMIEEVKKAGLVLFCWGEDNNNSNTLNTLKQKGVDGIIYDRIDFYKSTKTSVFKMEKEQKRQFLEQYGANSLNVTPTDLDVTSGSEIGSDTSS